MKIHHVSLAAGELPAAPAAGDDDASSVISAWLEQVLAGGERRPLSLRALCHLSASAVEHDDALIVTLWSPAAAYRPALPHHGRTEMHSAFGVARGNAGAEIFWASPWAARLRPPPLAAPWWQGMPSRAAAAAPPRLTGWLPDLQSAIAAAWLRRPADAPVRPAAAAVVGLRAD
jgi:hypothetical protein